MNAKTTHLGRAESGDGTGQRPNRSCGGLAECSCPDKGGETRKAVSTSPGVLPIPQRLPQSPAATGRPGRAKPLLCLCGVRSLAGKNEDQVLRLLEEGQILWAFDLSLKPQKSRKELRVLPAAVADYLLGRTCSLEWPQVFNLILPCHKQALITGEITLALNISGSHLSALAERKQVKQLSAGGHGPGRAARFSTESVIEFLKARRV